MCNVGLQITQMYIDMLKTGTKLWDLYFQGIPLISCFMRLNVLVECYICSFILLVQLLAVKVEFVEVNEL